MIDGMARTYSCLPSHILRHADTFDLMVFDVSIANQEIETAKRDGKPIPEHLTPKQDLEEVFKKVTGRDGKVQHKHKAN